MSVPNEPLTLSEKAFLHPSQEARAMTDLTAKDLQIIALTEELEQQKAGLEKLERLVGQLIAENKILQKETYETRDLAKYVLKEHSTRLTKLEAPLDKIPQKRQQEKSEVLIAILLAHPGPMPVTDARHRLDMSKSQFSQLLATMKGRVESKPLKTDRRQHVISLTKP